MKFRIYVLAAIGLIAISATCRDKALSVEEPFSLEDRFHEAMSLYEQGQYAKAAEAFKSVAQHNPIHTYTDDAEYYLGMCYLKTGKPSEASSSFNKIVQYFPNSEFAPLAYIGLARAYLNEAPILYRDQSKTTDKAIITIETFLRKYPDHEKVPEAKAILAEARDRLAAKELVAIRVYENLMKYEAELHYADLCIQEFPESRLVWQAKLYRARALYFLLRDDEALATLGEIESSTEAGSDVKAEAIILRNQILARKQLK
ncbi:MAG: outer membrane protein assembly factor BamD [candidate division WOR-3 bacterium]